MLFATVAESQMIKKLLAGYILVYSFFKLGTELVIVLALSFLVLTIFFKVLNDWRNKNLRKKWRNDCQTTHILVVTHFSIL